MHVTNKGLVTRTWKEGRKERREGRREEIDSRTRICDENKTSNKEDATEPGTYVMSLIHLINIYKHYKQFIMLKMVVPGIQ